MTIDLPVPVSPVSTLSADEVDLRGVDDHELLEAQPPQGAPYPPHFNCSRRSRRSTSSSPLQLLAEHIVKAPLLNQQELDRPGARRIRTTSSLRRSRASWPSATT